MTKTNSIKSTAVAGYIVRSATQPRSVLAEDGEFYDEGLLGPGARCAKVYRTERNARKVRDGEVTTHAVNACGIEIAWLRAHFPDSIEAA